MTLMPCGRALRGPVVVGVVVVVVMVVIVVVVVVVVIGKNGNGKSKGGTRRGTRTLTTLRNRADANDPNYPITLKPGANR